MLRFALLAALVVIVGCNKAAPPTPVTQATPPVPAWQKRSDELAAAIKVGMTEDEVTKAVGDPNRTKALMTSGNAMVVWEYDLDENNHFKVRFDKANRVASAKYESDFEVK